MRLMSVVLAVVLGLSAALASLDVDAKRLGGGKSTGKQSSNVTQREAAPSAPGAPGAAAAAKPAAPAAAAAPAVAPKKPWGAMLGGLAAGLGLAWLASSLGLGGALSQMLMFGLLALAIMVGVGWFMRRRAQNAAQNASQGNGQGGSTNSPFAMQGAGAGGPVNSSPAAEYSPNNVGNDASARPWERSSMAFEAPKAAPNVGAFGGGSMIGAGLSGAAQGASSGLSGSQTWGIPADFDAEGFLGAAKGNFVRLQAAWDKSDIGTLRLMMTDEMLTEIKAQLAEREAHSGTAANVTEVAALDAKLLGIEELPTGWMASIEFTGMIREDAAVGAQPFREVWNMSKPKEGTGGWLVSGVQALG